MRKPYIKKLKKIGKFTVWKVDGNYIRKHIEKEFTNYAQHRRFPVIPKWEWWLDKEYTSSEGQFYIDYLLAESRFIEQGMSVKDAIKNAARIERNERAKSAAGKLARKGRKKVHKKIYKKKLKTYSKGVNVWIVDGELVRVMYYIDFTEGGHDLVYRFIPKGEVWIDDDIGPHERKYVILHEIYERFLMLKGKDYDKVDLAAHDAHYFASQLEYKGRHNSAFFKKKLKEVLKKNAELEKGARY